MDLVYLVLLIYKRLKTNWNKKLKISYKKKILTKVYFKEGVKKYFPIERVHMHF